MTKKFDLIVIGTGTAASTTAYKCRSAGWEVAIIDSRPFGGTCALRGCDPKKVLVGAAELIDWNNRMNGKGISSKGIQINWSELVRFKRTFTESVPKNREKAFSDAGIATSHGRARFVEKTTIKVGDDTLTGRHVLIASGAKPATLNIPGEEYLTTSDQFLELDKLPEHIIFIGGGYISFEFAHVAARAGAKVQILHRGARPLMGFDSDLVEQLVQATRDIGVDIRLNTTAKAIEKSPDHLIIHASVGHTEQKFEADMVVHGAGRVPEIDDLDLEKANVKSDKKGVIVNEYLQSISNPTVYAAGDAAASPGLPLTPVAAMEGDIVASNLLKGDHLTPDYTGVPTVVFTVPPLASVGLREETARERGLKFRITHRDTSGWYSSRRVGMKYSGFKVLVEEESDRILGAHLLGPHAEEVINLFAIAIRLGISATDLKKIPYAYRVVRPTLATWYDPKVLCL
ncbi:MAG: NAD(P)/FAD-dependent oxidoreductase [Candidatus Dadabacteria bacterium]|nr:NAD(P)/FAD-dependent oxidoreductase [Candidatus Dadabacteria bacterium]